MTIDTSPPTHDGGGEDRPRVLLVDDERVIREALRDLLEEMGFHVVGVASDGAEAVELASSLRPAVVLMDLRMPRMDGIEAARRIKADGPHTQVVILSAYEDESLQDGAIDAGVASYLVKGCRPTVIRDVLLWATKLHRRLEEAIDATESGRVVEQADR
jgi:DNA-binding NarL/FixJ family response regulator